MLTMRHFPFFISYFCIAKPLPGATVAHIIYKYMKKYISDLRVKEVSHPRKGYVLLKLTDENAPLPEMQPGQFVEIRIDGSATTFLRRPISINFVDPARNELWLLVHVVGDGTRCLSQLKAGDALNCVYPLGKGFSVPSGGGKRLLLVGGGVGTAPLLFYGKLLREAACEPVFLLGGRKADDLMQLADFGRYGQVLTTTEDGSHGVKGFVTDHPVWETEAFDGIATCGPKPMMVAVARLAAGKGVACEASLENMMACGLGACLCCVEKTKEGNLCVCKEGPVFDTRLLNWL